MFLNILSKNEIYNVHLSCLEILEFVGVKVPSEKVLKMLSDAGAEVDLKEWIAKIPSYLVEEMIKKVPHKVALYDREGREIDLKPKSRKMFFGTVGFATRILDFERKEYRSLRSEDLARLTLLADALENMDVYMTTGSPSDVPLEIVDRYMWLISLMNTKKHVVNEANHREGALDAIKMASEIVGGFEELKKKPIISILISITSPFRFDKPTFEAFLEAVKADIPVYVNSGPLAGANSPVTLAGTLTLNVTELLSSIVISRLINRRSRILPASWARTMDMREGSAVLGGPEFALLHAAFAQVMDYYNIPCVAGGILSDAKALDVQVGSEKTLTALVPLLAGVNIVHGMGLIASENLASLEQLVIDNEIAGMAKRIRRGIDINEETLATDLMRKTGLTGGFFREKHTLTHFKSQLWFPKIFDRRILDAWLSEGAVTIDQKAHKEVEKITSTHKPPEISKGTGEKLMEIVKEAERRSVK